MRSNFFLIKLTREEFKFSTNSQSEEVMEDKEESNGSCFFPQSKKMKFQSEEEKKSEEVMEDKEESNGSCFFPKSKKMKFQSEEEKKSEEEKMAISLDLPDYTILSPIGEGAFGKVYKAEHNTTKRFVAVKVLKGSSHAVRRERDILMELQPHPNIIQLIEVIGVEEIDGGGPVYFVFELMDDDLKSIAERILSKKHQITDTQIKSYMHQLLSGLAHLHAKQALHRDIKGANILLNKKGDLKIADFGLSRFIVEGDEDYLKDALGTHYSENFTPNVITLPYRPPELLLGSEEYDFKVDVWSAGVVFAQLLNQGQHILRGSDIDDQVKRICELCGTPNEGIWPGVSKFTEFNRVGNMNIERCLKETYKHFASKALALLDDMLVLDPSKRITAEEALRHPYFLTER